METHNIVEPHASPPFSDRKQRKLKAAQTKLLYAQSGIGSLGAFLGALILGGALWKVVSHDRIVVWVLAYAALFLGRHCLTHFFNKQEPDEDEVIKWGKWHTLAVSAGGLMWGVAGVWLFPQGAILHQFLLAIFVAGIGAASIVIYSPTKDYAFNLLPALLPLSFRFIYEYDKFHVITGSVMLLFAGVLLVTGRRMHTVYADSLMLRYDKEELVEDLKQEIAQRDRLQAELRTARDDLEIRVEGRTDELKALNRTLEQEIVERKQVEEELIKSEEKYRLLAENATDMVWTLDLATLKFTYISPSIQKIRGYSPAEALDLSLDKTLTPDSHARAVKILGEELERDSEPDANPDRIRLVEFQEFCKDGSIIETEARIKFLRDVNGLPIGLLGITREVTDRKRAEELAMQTERLKAIGDLAGGVAHNFNNLLQMVVGGIDLALVDLETGDLPELKKTLEQLLQASRSGAATVRRLQSFAQIRGEVQPPEGETFDLSDTVKQAAEMTKPFWKTGPDKEGIGVALNLKLTDRCFVNAKESEISEVLVNLVKNAAEALPKGGEILISTFFQGDQVVLQVADNGVGIRRDHLKKVFEPFWSTKGVSIGTGMGLAVSHGIISSHGGTISVESEEGKGTTFTVTLPLANEPSEVPVLSVEEASRAKLNLLVIDDMAIIVMHLKGILTRHQHAVFSATSGERGVEIFRNNKIDLVICDLGMSGMNGYEVGKAVQAICQERGIPKTPFILLTGWDVKAQEQEKMIDSGVDAILKKPLDAKKLLAAISKVVARVPPRDVETGE
ncbi:MAG TPA: ATP-binding protein [Desulfomonilaceae bacterium]|nr:ATP-binding protein [Desulfomonilaceae bacterium]